jgi:hypothetical protein
MVFKNKYLVNLVKWFFAYKRKAGSKNHGLRDFYSMIKYISMKITQENDEENETIIL